MRDLRNDLQERDLLAREINSERGRYEMEIARLTGDRDRRLEELSSQLCDLQKIIAFETWRHDARAALLKAIAAADAVEAVEKARSTSPLK